MGPAVLVTLGVLFLLTNMADYPFGRTWPILLIVIGAIKVLRYVIPEEGHLNPGEYPSPHYQASSYPGAPNPGAVSGPPARGPIVTPPPAPSAGALGDGRADNDSVDNDGVHHG
jgi:hypothetical protein